MNTNPAFYLPTEIEKISNRISLIDYFFHLERKGVVSFDRKSGHDYYFRTTDHKFSVSEKGYYDFKSAEGGQIIKAVMELEKLEWKEAVKFIKDFSEPFAEKVSLSERKTFTSENRDASFSDVVITNSFVPNNDKLLSYFEDRGISKEILIKNTRQVHYEAGGKKYFGIGIENISQGFEIRNPLIKSKIGKNDISEIKGSKEEIIIFEGMTDMLSFLQLLKDNEQTNKRTLVTLNSITNIDKFLQRFQDFSGKMFLCLDGDQAGNIATRKILEVFKGKNIKDIRPMYQISEDGNNDLNDYLKNKKDLQNESIKLVKPKNAEHETPEIESNRTSETQQVEQRLFGQNAGEYSQSLQPGQNNNHSIRNKMERDHVGNGFKKSEWRNFSSEGDHRSAIGAQQNHAEKNEGRQHSVGGGVESRFRNSAELEELIVKYKGQKLTNEQVAEVVSAACFISKNHTVLLKEHINVTDDLRTICNQFKSGGTEKKGRGILDEYYTDIKIVSAVRTLIQDQFKDRKEIAVLEPSVGIGTFINASKGLALNVNITAFEINETAAKIAKILFPDAVIHLRSFETEFIGETGVRKNFKDFSEKYDLVLGNPPYGEHRGLYKGLGEESKISKYEDYFVKRGIDSLKNDGILAMVLPSGWLNRQNKLEQAELINAFRLPRGIFSGTQVGTDIIILKKTSILLSQNIANHFDQNPQNVLGEIRERTNRFGRLENYVEGNLGHSLFLLENLRNKNEEVARIGNLFEDITIEENSSGSNNIPNQTASHYKEKIDQEEFEIPREVILNTQDKIGEVLLKLGEIKFKSPSIFYELEKYSKLHQQIGKNIHLFSAADFKGIIQKSDKILQSHKSLSSEYVIQTHPLIKKGILKYQFNKRDQIVNASLQNSSDITEEQILSFKATSYDGTITNHSRHFDFANYYNGKYIHDFYYAEGNIYQKLEQLEKDYSEDWGIGGLEKKQYEKQKSLLESVLPKLKNLEEISISPNHEFVSKFKLGQVEKEQYNYESRSSEVVLVDYNLAEKFKDFVSSLPSEVFAGSSAWEVRSFVDNESVTGSDKERNALVRNRRKTAANDLFYKFIREELSDDLRNRFVQEFNRNYNNIYVPDYSKFPLFSKIHQNFKGQQLQLTEVQKAGIGRQTTKGVGLLAHEVGFGKTLSGLLSIHEAMERGNSKKPLIVVPNDSILKQWVETIFETIPQAKVNVLGNLGMDYDLSRFMNKEGEITLVTYEGFNNIGFCPDITERLSSKFNYISASELKSVTNTERDLQIELQKEKEIEGKMKRGKVYDWEDFGFDHLTFDEVHNANHIVGKVKLEDRRFSSDFRNQNQQTSKLGINTWMAAQYIQDQQNGRNITLLSATPFTNKPLEYYSILSLIANKRLEESGYFNVNTFFETFMETDNDMEIDAKGEVKFKANVRRFKNNALFQQLLSEFIDVKGEEDNPELIRPNKINKEYRIEQNDLTLEQYNLLNKNFCQTEKGAILTHILSARLIAFSPYLSIYYNAEEPSVTEFIENSPKLFEMMKLIRQNKIDIPDTGQIIYSELAVAQFPKLKEYLVKEVDFKPEEIGIITGVTSKKQRVSIQDDFNNGNIKIIIGSEAIQEGMNLQENTSDVYLLTLPYNFTSLRQIEGRAWRQGNRNENVRINYMLTNDSIDVFMLQKLQAKQARYLEAMKRGANVLDVSDISTQDLKTSIITHPETRANIEIELLKKKIETQKNRFLADSAFVLRKYEAFLKVREEVTKAENSYNRILGYAKDSEESKSDYWEKQLPFYQKAVDLAKAEVQSNIVCLAEKGVNVKEIEKQTEHTAENIAELDKLLEEIPLKRDALILRYIEEQEKQKKEIYNKNLIEERAGENIILFSSAKTSRLCGEGELINKSENSIGIKSKR